MDNVYNRTFIASSEIFSGFKIDIDIRRINTLQDIVDIFLTELKKVLVDMKLPVSGNKTKLVERILENKK